MEEIEIFGNSFAVGKKIVDLTFPRTAIIAMIKRNDKYITPNGSTVIEAQDKLIVLADSPNGMGQVYEALKINKEGAPWGWPLHEPTQKPPDLLAGQAQAPWKHFPIQKIGKK